MDNIKLEKIAQILQDEKVAAEFKGVGKDKAIELLAAKGVELTADEFEEIGKIVSEETQELSEDALDTVAGGLSWKQYWSGLKSTLKGFWDGIWS